MWNIPFTEITASLHISSRHDVDQFIYKLATSNAEPLLVLTEGLHLHTLTAKDLETLRRVEQVLKEHEFLASDLNKNGPIYTCFRLSKNLCLEQITKQKFSFLW